MTVQRYYDREQEKEEQATHGNQLDRLRAAISQLSDFDKRIVTLRDIEGLSNRET